MREEKKTAGEDKDAKIKYLERQVKMHERTIYLLQCAGLVTAEAIQQAQELADLGMQAERK